MEAGALVSAHPLAERSVAISLTPMRRALVLAIASVSLAGLAAELYLHLADSIGPSELEWGTWLSLGYESNLPSWFACCLLFTCGLLLACLGALAGLTEAGHRLRWKFLAGAFFFVSLDELVGLHERANDWYEGHGILYYSWVLVGGAAVLAIGLLIWPLLRDLHERTRRRFIAAAVLYVTGALFIELPLGYVAERGGDESLTYALIDWCEETLELSGTGLFLATLLGLLRGGPAGPPGDTIALSLPGDGAVSRQVDG